MIHIPEGKKVILFDGVCNLCNNFVIKVIKYDTRNKFLFAAIQSESGKKIIDHLKIDISKTDSIILYEPNIAYHIKSSAALNIMSQFGGIWPVTQIFKILPESFRNMIYDFIAKNRYNWFGKKESCMIPTAELKSKFLN